ncbi:hypothetical protein F5Y16DRAFT_402458 [Xylariaceae sp. FL0255]|nr:hypothetical protein F5Y16DRAFT_402458 [Xylariaceae sp. FL0255]
MAQPPAPTRLQTRKVSKDNSMAGPQGLEDRLRAPSNTIARQDPEAQLSMSSNAADLVVDESSLRPKFSYGQQLNIPMAAIDESEETSTTSGRKSIKQDWLDKARVDLRQDLQTSKKELSVMRCWISELEENLSRPKRTERQNARLEKNLVLLKTCKEHSMSRLHLLVERIRQADHWQRISKIGHEAPDKAPTDWRIADDEWHEWLADKAATLSHETSRPMTETDMANWRIWGPLYHILDVSKDFKYVPTHLLHA